MGLFGNKTDYPGIDKEQLALIENAQKRIKQKKGLYIHFISFVIVFFILFIVNVVFGVNEDIKVAGLNWFVFPILLWSFFLIYHFINVFFTHKFMNKDWENQQLNKLVALQKKRIEELNQTITDPEKKNLNQHNN